MEKRLMLLAKLLKKKFSVSYIRYAIWNYSRGKDTILEFTSHNGIEFITASTIPELIDVLIRKEWINKEDLIPKTRTKKEITTTNKGKFITEETKKPTEDDNPLNWVWTNINKS